jgi:L-lactate dehydrogenase complex protein LldG
MSEATSGSRERILQRISTALGTRTTRVNQGRRTAIFPQVESLVERFAAECKNNYTECVFTNSPAETRERLQEITSSLNGVVYAQDAPEIRDAVSGSGANLAWSSEGPAPENAQATITVSEALIAATGSILVSSRCAGRGGTIVAPVHIVIAKGSQWLPDIEAALQFASASGLTSKSSFVGIITGCSRTADIEKLLVIGAHGPKRLVVIVES